MHNTLPKMKAMRLLLAAAQLVAALGNATLASIQPQLLEAVYGAPAAALAAGSAITGRAFQDYNANGLYDTTGVAPTLAIDRGVAGRASLRGGSSAARAGVERCAPGVRTQPRHE